MGEILLEEKIHLNQVLNLIDNEIINLESNKPFSGISRYSVGADRTERENLMYQKNRNEQSYIKIEHLNGYIDSPYFARMDLEIENSIEEDVKVYIGKRSLTINGRELVYDWRSPIGNQYYLKNQLKFKYAKYNYKLLLRRALNISNSQLISYNNEYTSTNKTESADISDPFLIRILKQKRQEYRLSDIIRTIQQNQNDIINFPPRKSFIVQGCAGSGKTMIMLHRLSFIKYNNPSMDVTKVKIITPNDNLNMFINQLSIELELDKIERYTVEQYYLNLLNRYDPISWNKKMDVVDDSLIEISWITHVYSQSFFNQLVQEYNSAINELCSTIENNIINKIASKGGMLFNMNKHSTAAQLNNLYVEFLEKIIKDYNISISDMKKLEMEINRLKEYKDKMLDSKVIKEVISRFELDKSIIKSKLEDYQIEIANILQSREVILIRQKLDFKDGPTINSGFINSDEILGYLDDFFKKNNKNKLLFKKIGEVIQKEEEIIILEKDLAGLSIFNLRKKRDLKARIYILRVSTNSSLDYERLNGKEIKINQNHLGSLKSELEIIRNSILSEIEVLLLSSVQEKAKRLFVKKGDLEREMSILDREYSKSTERLKRQDKLIIDNEAKHEELKNNIITDHEMSEVMSVLNQIKERYHFKEIYKRTFGRIVNEASMTYGIPSTNTLNRYNLYLILQFYSLYFGGVTKNDSLINIDEGQDLSGSEYSLLRRINGNNAVFNIYGDTNQLVNKSGIKDWGILSDFDNKFTLNENYRNTIEITNFCNTILGFNVTPIGLDGKGVIKVSEGQALELLKVHLANDRLDRYAVIVDSLDYDFVKKCIAIGCSSRNLDNGKVVLLTVVESKGLEFDKTFVFDKNMTRNQKYIAYTRALNELVIIE